MAFCGGGESYCVSAIIVGAGEVSCSNRAHIIYSQYTIQQVQTKQFHILAEALKE